MAETQLTKIHNNIGFLLKEKMQALPNNFNQTRFLQNCIAVLQDTKDIEKMEPRSIARTMLKGAFLGLDFLNRECYAIPYGKNIGTKQKPKWIKELQFQTDYKGEIKLAKKYSLKKIHDIYAKIVRQEDYFEEIVLNGKQTINFTPIPFGDAEIIGAFAVCMYADNSMIYETMSFDEINHVRQTYSKVPDAKAWKDSFGEMAKKTVLRRLCKNIELEFDSVEQKKEYDDSSEFEFKDITDIVTKEPVEMPKEKKLPAKAQEGHSDAPGSTTLDSGSADSPMDEIIEESPPESQVSDEKDASKGRTRNGIISDMRSWARQKSFDLELLSMTNFEKEVEELDMFELGQLEDEVTKIKTKPE